MVNVNDSYRIKDEYFTSAVLAIYNYKGDDIYCEIIEDLGDRLKLRGHFRTARVMPTPEIRIIKKDKLKFIY